MYRDIPLFKGITYTWHGFPYALRYEDILFAGGVDVFTQKVISYNFSTGDYKSFSLSNTQGHDDHNMVAPIVNNGKLMVFYVGHNQKQEINYRVNPNNLDVYELSEEKTIQASGSVSYISVLNYADSIYLISRVGQDSWAIWYSDDNGDTWSDEKTLTSLPRFSGANYVNAGKRNVFDDEAGIVFAGHGAYSQTNGNHSLHFFGLDLKTGDLKRVDDTVIANVKTGEGLPLDRSQGTEMYGGDKPATIQNTMGWQRSGVSREPMISYITYNENWDSCNYEVAYWNSDVKEVVNIVVEENVNGKLMEQTHKHQFGGFQLFGNQISPRKCDVALSKKNESTGLWEVWRYHSDDLLSGFWNKEKVDESHEKVFRPINIYTGGSSTFNNPLKFLWLKGYFNYFRDDFSTGLKSILTKE